MRKGGKLEKVREDKLFVIEEILPNGNVTLQDMDLNLLEPFLIPMKHAKKIKIGKLHSSETTCTMTTKMTDTLTKTTNSTDGKDEEMEKIQEKYGNKKEDNIIILGQSPPSVITFKSLNRISRKEVEPLLRVNRFENIGFQNISAQLNGPARGIKQIDGDRNCYF